MTLGRSETANSVVPVATNERPIIGLIPVHLNRSVTNAILSNKRREDLIITIQRQINVDVAWTADIQYLVSVRT